MSAGGPQGLARLRRDWEELAREDPLWFVLSTEAGKHGAWDTGDFFRTGEREIAAMLEHAEPLGRPVQRRRALDFGCGVGRATRALASHFEEVVGLDISEQMVSRARELNADCAGCTFLHNDLPDLRGFEDGRFDMVYTGLVLQHQPDETAIERYLRELVRVLDPGGLLAFQLPRALPWRLRVQPRRRLFLLLSRLGLRTHALYWRLGLHPVEMRALPEQRVRPIVESAGGMMLDVVARRDRDFGFDDALYFVTKS